MISISIGDDSYSLIKIHDYFNILILPLIFLVDIYFLSNFSFIYGHCDFLFWLFLSYILVDLGWILYVPKSVGQMVPIAVHHVLTIIGWSISIYDINVSFATRMFMLVEINTWFNILKRYVKHEIIYKLFYFTWFLFRIIQIPALTYNVTLVGIEYYYRLGTLFNITTPVLICAYILCVLNFKWTYDLVTKRGYLGVSSKKD